MFYVVAWFEYEGREKRWEHEEFTQLYKARAFVDYLKNGDFDNRAYGVGMVKNPVSVLTH